MRNIPERRLSEKHTKKEHDRALVKMAEYVNIVLAFSYDHMKIATKL